MRSCSRRMHPSSHPGTRYFYLFLIVNFFLQFGSAFIARSSRPSIAQRTNTAIMGIKGFRAWLETKFPECVVDMPRDNASETFDHVLIDMNQLLHVVLRRSRSDGHGLTLLMKELDACLQLATPTKSLVLAIDGPPGAAKLATQRKRRFATVAKTEHKIKQIDRLLKSESKRHKPALLNRKKRRAASEARTLCITPATDFMSTAEQALLYWVWQRLSSRTNCLAANNVKVFISPSTVPGEGEIKLLEWIYSKPNRRGESIAILGGDSDLVLEGLVIPPASTHNVFILLPEGNKRYLSVSLWELTRSLHQRLPHLSIENIMKTRTDLALLLILNGNDYLPKLRGSNGFNKLFHTYLRVHKAWESEGKADRAFLVHPDTLDFNLEFCIDFFERLVAIAPNGLWSSHRAAGGTALRKSALHQLNNFVEAGYLPGPVKFEVRDESIEYDEDIEDDDGSEEESVSDLERRASESEGDDYGNEDESDEDELAERNQVLIRLSLGEPESDDYNVFEVWYPKGKPLKTARHKLAAMALSDLIETDDSSVGSSDNDNAPGFVHSGYEWEIHTAVEGKTDAYLYGLLWNLQTYQDGLCSDYGFNYGKRMSPTAAEIVEFLRKNRDEGRNVGLRELTPGSFTPSVSAGVSSLAALPSAVKHLLPEPYRSLDDEVIENTYASCMDRYTNVFDIAKFEKLCNEHIDPSSGKNNYRETKEMSEEYEGRRIIMGDHYWTIISKVPKPLAHPWAPPAPFSSRLSRLRSNSRIRVSRSMAFTEPRLRSVWVDHAARDGHKDDFVGKDSLEVIHSDPGFFLRRHGSIESVRYKTAYAYMKKKHKRMKREKIKLTLRKQDESTKSHGNKNVFDSNRNKDHYSTEEKHNSSAGQIPATLDKLTGMACLKQLEDAGLIGPISWELQSPSFASDNTSESIVETITLSVGKGKLVETRLTYSNDRIEKTSRQSTKQHLASLALADIIGKDFDWSKLLFKEIKALLIKRTQSH